MEKNQIYEFLIKELPEEQIRIDEPMKNHTNFKIGGNADIYVIAKTIEQIQLVLKLVKQYQIPLTILGNGSNVLVSDKGISGIVLLVGIETYNITQKEKFNIIEVGAGVKLSQLSYDLLKKGIQGFEFASRNTRNNWWCCKNECRSTWKRNERYSSKNHIYGL